MIAEKRLFGFWNCSNLGYSDYIQLGVVEGEEDTLHLVREEEEEDTKGLNQQKGPAGVWNKELKSF